MTPSDLDKLRFWARDALRGIDTAHVFNLLWSPSMTNIIEEPVAALQFAAAILLDKPIYILAPEGAVIPPRVQQVADGIEFYKGGDPDSLKRATIRLMSKATGVDVRM